MRELFMNGHPPSLRDSPPPGATNQRVVYSIGDGDGDVNGDGDGDGDGDEHESSIRRRWGALRLDK